MKKILLIEPDKMLRHAFTVALCPEFQVERVADFPPTVPSDFDAVIVDVATLRVGAADFQRAIVALAEWRLPTICIDSHPPGLALDHVHCVQLSRPVARETLRQSLMQCLGTAGVAARHDGIKLARSKTPRTAKRNVKTRPERAVDAGENIIELVDIVEEEADR